MQEDRNLGYVDPTLVTRLGAPYLWLYPGKGDGKLGARIRIGTGAGWFYGGTGKGTFNARVKVNCGWNAMDLLAAVGDFNGDGHPDWIARVNTIA